ncbi:MAG: N,N'-diacetylchitobiose phosphorylase [Eubacteriales bacterium]
MKHGYFDNENREYVIDRVDLPTSWTNYIGTKDMYGVFNHTAGGYLLYKTPEYHRITRFRPNGVPMDFPGHYVYVRDDDTGEFWTISWQPVGKNLEKAKYVCRHGMSYSKYECDYNDIFATQKLSVAMDEPVELWDISLKNNDGKERNLSVFTYVEWSFHHIAMDNQNFQMSLYASGSRYENGIIEYDLYYEEKGFQYLAASFEPDSFDCTRDTFIGSYRTESNPIAVERGCGSNSFQTSGNHCGVLHKKLKLAAGEETRLFVVLGEGGLEAGRAMREKYANAEAFDREAEKLAAFWEDKLGAMQIQTPDQGLNTLINIWTMYQSEVNVLFSRFTSFIEVGGRTGLGYRDTAQDAMTIPHAEPNMCKTRIIQLMQALTSEGYGLHLFSPSWFEESDEKPFKSPTVVPEPDKSSIVHGIEDACSDDALWLVTAVANYVKETGEFDLLDMVIPYCDKGEDTIYDRLKTILDFSAKQVGASGICKGLRADWNDCLNLGGGESAMVSFLHHWALGYFVELAEYLGKTEDVKKYQAMRDDVKEACERELWDKEWYIRGITAHGKKIGTTEDTEGQVHLESNAWAVLSGVATGERAQKCLDSIDKYLYTDYGLILNAPPFETPNEDIGFVTRVYPGVKENGAVFSHPNPWAWAAECMSGNGERAHRYYEALCPYNQNDKIEIRYAEPYSYCQFIYGNAHELHGRACHPFMTGSGGWSYFSATQYIMGVKPGYDSLEIDPCIPASWESFSMRRRFRGATYNIQVNNPDRVQKGIAKIVVDGKEMAKIPVIEKGATCEVVITMGEEA